MPQGTKFIAGLVSCLVLHASPARASLHEALEAVARATATPSLRHLPPAETAGWAMETHAARQYALDHALDAAEALVERVAAHDLNRAMEAELRRLSHRQHQRLADRTVRLDFTELNRVRLEFEEHFASELHDVAFALALRYPRDVRSVVEAANTPIPRVHFKKEMPPAILLDWDLLPEPTQAAWRTERLVAHNIEPYVSAARRALRDLRRRDTMRDLCGATSLMSK